MAEYLIQGETLTGIADAIRSKTGITDAIDASLMASAILGISSGNEATIAFDSFSIDTYEKTGVFFECPQLPSVLIMHGPAIAQADRAFAIIYNKFNSDNEYKVYYSDSDGNLAAFAEQANNKYFSITQVSSSLYSFNMSSDANMTLTTGTWYYIAIA